MSATVCHFFSNYLIYRVKYLLVLKSISAQEIYKQQKHFADNFRSFLPSGLVSRDSRLEWVSRLQTIYSGIFATFQTSRYCIGLRYIRVLHLRQKWWIQGTLNSNLKIVRPLNKIWHSMHWCSSNEHITIYNLNCITV